MKSDITIVTAFFDIGRENWEGFERSSDMYIDRFKHLTKLNNKIIVYTSPDLVEKIQAVSKYITVIPYNFLEETLALRKTIKDIQSSDQFTKKLTGRIRKNPESWSPEYVAVTSLKAFFVSKAISDGHVDTELVSWIDFGYCRNEKTVPTTSWSYNFDSSKIHMLVMNEINTKRPMGDIIYSGDVYVQGCQVIAGKHLWPWLEESMKNSLDNLMHQGLVDDDQGLFLMSYLKNPNRFILRYNKSSDWFIIFKEYNIS
jgi:protein YibB